MSENKEIKLTPEELEAEKQDRELLAQVRALNGTNPPPLSQLFPDVQPGFSIHRPAYDFTNTLLSTFGDS